MRNDTVGVVFIEAVVVVVVVVDIDMVGDEDAVEAPLNGLYGGEDNGGIIPSSCVDCSHIDSEAIQYSVFIGLFCVAVVHIIDFLLFFFLLQIFVCFC